MSEKAFMKLLEKVRTRASEEEPLEIPITYEKATYIGPKAEVVELVDFVILPATAKNIDRQYARGYGKRFYMRAGEIRRKMEEGVWYEDACKRILAGQSKGSDVSAYVKSKDKVEGLGRSGKSDDYEFYELVYHFRWEGDDDETKISLIYSYDEEEMMAMIEYPYRTDYYALFKIASRPNRLIGESVLDMVREQNAEIDTQHNQRIHAREITTIPSFKGKKDAQKDFDPAIEGNMFHPGVIFWLDDPEAFEQFKIQPTDLGESMTEEKNTIQICDLNTGVNAFHSAGLPDASDPDAPGNKTAMLISQTNMRMDDPLRELRNGIEKLGEICLSHLYQFGPTMIEGPQTRKQPGQEGSKPIPKRLLRKGIKIKMAAITVSMNPEVEFQKWMNYYQALIQEPLIGQSPKRRTELLRMALRMGRITNREKILPNMQEIEQEEVKYRMLALQQMQQQRGKAAQDQALRANKDRTGALQDRVRTDNLTGKLRQGAVEKEMSRLRTPASV